MSAKATKEFYEVMKASDRLEGITTRAAIRKKLNEEILKRASGEPGQLSTEEVQLLTALVTAGAKALKVDIADVNLTKMLAEES